MTEAGTDGLKAKYDELLRHSREWERRAKSNQRRADEAEALAKRISEGIKEKDGRINELSAAVEAANRRAAEAADEASKRDDERESAEHARKVSAETGVPESVLAAGRDGDPAGIAVAAGRWFAENPQAPALDDRSHVGDHPQGAYGDFCEFVDRIFGE